MDVSTSALTGALRVGLQIVVAQKRPVLEIYQNFHNDFEPPFEHKRLQTTHRRQSIFIDLTMVNIGGVRAEDVSFEVEGDFRRETPFEAHPERLSSVIRQVAPGQSMFLMTIRSHDLNTYAPENPEKPVAFKPVGVKTETMTIKVNYNGPTTVVNWPKKLWCWFRGTKPYHSEYVFDPAYFIGELPPPNYLG